MPETSSDCVTASAMTPDSPKTAVGVGARGLQHGQLGRQAGRGRFQGRGVAQGLRAIGPAGGDDRLAAALVGGDEQDGG